MSTLLKIEEDIKNLDKQEFSELRDWFQDFESKRWDEQIKSDISSGKLNELANSAIADFQNGNYKAV